jgi:hypothetical protein
MMPSTTTGKLPWLYHPHQRQHPLEMSKSVVVVVAEWVVLIITEEKGGILLWKGWESRELPRHPLHLLLKRLQFPCNDVVYKETIITIIWVGMIP